MCLCLHLCLRLGLRLSLRPWSGGEILRYRVAKNDNLSIMRIAQPMRDIISVSLPFCFA